MKKIIITTQEPLILDHRSTASNEHETLDYFPASRLRGSFFEAWRTLGLKCTVEELLGLSGPAWTDAYPADDECQPKITFPLCELIGSLSKDKPRGWAEYVSGSLCPAPVLTEIGMRVGRDYGRLAHRDQALYARMALAPKQTFVAWVDVGDSILPDAEFKWNLGTRHSANGKCSIVIQSTGDSLPEAYENIAHVNHCNPPLGCVVVQLLSDAILPGEFGGYLRGLDSCAFQSFSGDKSATVLASYSSSKTVSGWSGKWNLPRESAIAIERGSIWLVSFTDNVKRREFVESCKAKGMGIRGYEGFGFVSVNPKWIRCIEEKRNGEAIFSLRFDLKVGKASAHKVLPMDLDTIGTTQIAIDRANTIEQGRLKAELGDVRQWITAVAREKNLNQLLALDRILPSTLQLRAQSLGSNQEQNREAALRYFRAFETCLQKRVDESSIPSPATPIPSQEAE